MTKTRPKILIIDDNASIIEYLKTVLNRYNFTIKTSMNGYDGLQDVAEFKPDIILLDLMMPNIDGIQMLQLKKVLNDIKSIPVIVISANAGRNNIMAAIEAGAERVLAKPINIKQLKSSINDLLGGDFFDMEKSEVEIELEEKECIKKTLFKEKFEEYKKNLIEAIKNRESNSIKGICKLLKDYGDKKNNSQELMIIESMESREYQKPSDWMFAEMKIKEIDQILKEVKVF